MAISVVADTMTGCAPALQDHRSVGIIYALTDREQKGACPAQVLQKTLFRFGLPILGDHLPPDIIHCDGDPRPNLREQGGGAQSQCLASTDSLQRLTVTHRNLPRQFGTVIVAGLGTSACANLRHYRGGADGGVSHLEWS